MRLANVRVENFRSVRHCEIPLSPFVCAVGHNNAGKSSMLMALSLFVQGTKLSRSDFYNPDDEVVITVTLEGVTTELLNTLAEEQRDRIAELVRDETLVLVRRFETNGSGKLKCIRRLPAEDRYSEENYSALMKGKSGADLKSAVLAEFPELVDRAGSAKTQGQFKELIASLIAELPPDAFVEREAPLPTGIDNSISHLLPEVVYIPAVRDATDEVKTRQEASFGRILKILLEMIDNTDQIKKIVESFAALNQHLNKVETPEGIFDDRIEEVRNIEERVAGYIREQFRDIKIDIQVPPPDIKTIFSNAKILLDDGVVGEIDTKGDGLKRAVLFALLRTFVDLRNIQRQSAPGDENAEHKRKRYLFLFEEPELYLHPGAQRILYDALVEISSDHQVCVCTHSPYFFSATGSGTFLRLRKVPNEALPPVTDALPVALVGSTRDAFQIICYENNSAAFFCDRVVLVEGDCDLIYLKHIARMMNARWNFDRYNVAMIRIGGKGSFARYRAFYQSFDVEVKIVADLDAIVDQYNKLGAPTECNTLRDKLLSAADKIIAKNPTPNIATASLKKLAAQGTFRERYEHCKTVAAAMAAGRTPTKEELEMFGLLFAAEHEMQRRYVIANEPSLLPAKEKLLAKLREAGIFVLSKGAIEDYYPDDCDGPDKPSQAIAACGKVSSIEQALQCCPMLDDGRGSSRPEFSLLFEQVFEGLRLNTPAVA